MIKNIFAAIILCALPIYIDAQTSTPKVEQVMPLEKKAPTSFQGMAISGSVMASLQDRGYVRLYDLKTMKALTDTFRLGSFGAQNHANVAAFGVEKYSRQDPLPLLYVSQAHRKALRGMKNACFVERLSMDGKAETVQRIVLDSIDNYYGYALQWTIDRRRKLLIGFGNTISNEAEGNRLRIMTFHLPRLKDGAVVRLKPSDALENYLLQDLDAQYPAKVIGQGAGVSGHCLWMPTGFGTEKWPSVIYVWNLKKHRLQSVIPLQRVMPHELEDIDFHRGRALIQTNGTGIISIH